MNILLVQIDGNIPNIALMRIASHHRDQGDNVLLVRGVKVPMLTFQADIVYVSLIFERSADKVALIRDQIQPGGGDEPPIIVGGTGWSLTSKLEDFGITTTQHDYSDYPDFRQSIGFTQRGCRLKCSFCVVPTKEGGVRESSTIGDIWRGEPWPKEILLLDNDFFGQPRWRERIVEIRDGGFKVSFNQGINARFLTDETAEAVGSVDYRDDSMKVRRVYTAWDSKGDEKRLFTGLERLVRYGVKPDHIMVYMLIGYWKGETAADRDYRRQKLRDFGARPYPMPFVRTPELVGFQRWVIRAYDKKSTWQEWKANNYQRVYPSKNRELRGYPD